MSDQRGLPVSLHYYRANAEVELCREAGKTRYSYRSNGEIELQLTAETWDGSKRQVQGIHGAAFACNILTADQRVEICAGRTGGLAKVFL